MDFVKREDQNVIDEENYKIYMENFHKSQIENIEYQHTPLSMEQLHQAMQTSLNASTIVHNLQLPLSPRQMSTLMLKTNHLSRNLTFNEMPAHLPRNLSSEIDLVHNLTNDLSQNLTRDDLVLNQNLNRLDITLARSLSNELELQNSLTQSLVHHLNEQELTRSLNNELSQNLRINDVSLPQNLRTDIITHNLAHEIDLSHHLDRQNIEQDILNQDESRRTPMVVPCVPDSHLLEQNLAQRLEQTMVQRLDQRLVNSSLNLHENPRQIEQNDHLLPMPFHIKSEQEDDGYFYDNINQGLGNVNTLNGNVSQVHSDHTQTNPMNLHQDNQMYSIYNNHISNIPSLNSVDIYSRPQNYVQNYVTSNVNRDNPQNLVIHRQFENASPYKQNEFKKTRQDDSQNDSKGANTKIEQPKENLKPTNQNKSFYTDYENMQYVINTEKNENDSNVQNKITNTEEFTMNIKGEYVCYKCSEVFPSKRGLKQHAKTCTENGENDELTEKTGKFCCSQCSYRCQSPAILKIHERTHTGEKPFSCTFCDYKSGQKNNVAKHILVHMKEKPFRCQYCDYRCAQKNNLVVHERTHTGYKPFACPYCDYRTVQKPNLVKHMYLHTDQKPFSCDMCSYRCVQKTNLTKHKQRHLNEKMGDKVEIKSQYKPYRPRQKSVKCPQCPYRCVQKSSLDKHLRFKHGDGAQNTELNQENNEQGLNLMKNDDNVKDVENVCEETIQNLSVKKDEQFVSDVCQAKMMEPLQIQS